MSQPYPVPFNPMAATESSTQTSVLADESAQRGFSRSILISAVRCTLTYVVLPFLSPFIGLAPGVGPIVGLIVGVIAIAANVFSIRRFWRADHRWKTKITVLHVLVIGLLLVLMALDVNQLVS